jgi:glycosyltransferase involved in cell wall biosynthesis
MLLGLRDDIGDLLAAADGWVMPSLNEGLPMALLEAGSMGLPVVASKVGGIPELLESERGGWLVNPGDAEALSIAMTALLRDPESGERRGHFLQKIVSERYSRNAMTQRYLDLYRI